MIDIVFKKLSNRIIDIKLDTVNDTKDKSNVIESTFSLNTNGYNINVESRIFLHLFIFSYFIELETSESEAVYRKVLNSFIKGAIEYYERELKRTDNIYSENKNRYKVYKTLKSLLEISESVFYRLISDIPKNIRENILKKTVSKFNSLNRELDGIVREKSSINTRIEKSYNIIEKIFETDIIQELKEYELEEVNIREYLLKIVEDSVKAIYTCIILDRGKSRENFKIIFNKDAWFLYFFSLIFSTYKEKGINLLKLSGNTDFLEFGATTDIVNKTVEKFMEENELKEVKKELEPEIFYLLLGTGYNEKAIYSTEYRDENYKFEIYPVDENENGIFDKGFKVCRLNKDFLIPDFVDMILTSDNNNLKRYVTNFVEKFDAAIEEINSSDYLTVDIETALNNMFVTLEENMREKYNEIKTLYDNSTKQQKIDIIREIMNIMAEKVNINLNSRNSLIKNYKTVNNSLKNKMNCEVQIGKTEIKKDSIYISHNLTDTERIKNEEIMIKILETDFQTVQEIKSIYRADIDEIGEKKNDTVKTLKDKLIEKYKEKSKIFIKIDMGADIYERDEIPEFVIHSKIFFYLITYSKIKSNSYFLGLKEKFRKIYFSVVADIIYMLNMKDSSLVYNLSFLKEYDYLGDVFEDIESYFLSLYLNNEKNIEKINFKTLREAENLLNVFKNALIDGYLYYKDNTDYLKNNNNISENKEIDIKSREILNYLIESLNFNEIFV